MKKKLYNSIPKNGLVWEWKLDGNALDTSWNWNNGTATNVTYISTDKGYQKQAGSFNGSSSYINLWSWNIWIWWNLDINFIYTPISKTTGSWYQALFNDWSAWQKNLFIYASSLNNGILTILNWNWGSSDDWAWWYLTYQLVDWVTYDIRYVRNGTTKTLYINWQQVATYTWWYSWWITSNTKYIWADSAILNIYWKLQSFRIYNRILSDSERQSIVQEWLRQLWAGSDGILSNAVAQFENYWDNDLENIIGWITASRTGWTTTTDNFWISKAITNPNYTWSSITYTAWYTFEDDWTWWAIKTNPTGLSATWINRTTTLRNIFLMNKTLSADEVTELERLCKLKYLYPFKKTLPPNLKDGLQLWIAWDNSTTTLLDNSWVWNATISSTPTIKRIWQHKYISLSSQSISWSSRTLWTTLCWEIVSWKWTFQVNPAYITATWISSTTKDLANIVIFDRTLSDIEKQQIFYSTFIS